MIRFFRKKSSKNQTFGKNLVKVDCVIVAVAHDAFKKMKLEDLMRMMNDKLVLIDVRGMFAGEGAKEKGFYYKRL